MFQIFFFNQCFLSHYRYRGAAHNRCNLEYQDAHHIPIIFHNLARYDAHLFIKQLSTKFSGQISVIPQNKERYIFFTKRVEGNVISLRFIDSFKFLNESLEKLASYQPHMEIVDVEFKKDGYSDEQIKLLMRKGVFPYDYVTSLEKLKESVLPSKDDFYSKLYGSHISDEDYEHAFKMWENFKCKTIGEYSDLYLKTDVIILGNVFENIREMILKSHKVDPGQFYTLPGVSWDAMLLYTEIILELLTEIDKMLFVEQGKYLIKHVSHPNKN